MSKISYRPDIDGLRALAIAPVVLYHAGFTSFSGGFVGVDVFFVISGFLITSVIASEAKDGRFSFRDFYERRVRRLAPALFVVLMTTLFVGYFIQIPAHFVATTQSSLSTTLFASNFYFAALGGYFDTPLSIAPLLHTWSLAVEEQFYIVWPPLLIWLVTRFQNLLATVAVLLLITSLFYAMAAVLSNSEKAFYWPHVRAWELLAGAIIALKLVPAPRRQRIADAASVAGLLLIAFAVFTYTDQTQFPGFMAFPPVLGAALLIWSGLQHSTPVKRLLSASPIVFVGLISYALYLWHWPLMAFRRGITSRELATSDSWIIIFASLVLATLTWRYLEEPIRKKRDGLTRQAIFKFATAVAACICGFAVAAVLTAGFIDRFPKEVRQLAMAATKTHMGTHCPKGAVCVLNVGSSPLGPVLVWGDSHAGAILPAFVKEARRTDTPLHAVWRPACPPLVDVIVFAGTRIARSCSAANELAYRALKKAKYKHVVLIARWNKFVAPVDSVGQAQPVPLAFLADTASRSRSLSENQRVMLRGLQRSIKAIRDSGARAWILLPVPNPLIDVPSAMAQNIILRREPGTSLKAVLKEWHLENSRAIQTIARRLEVEGRISVIDPTDLFCPGRLCLYHIEGQPLYCDASHLSAFGAEFARSLIASIFADTIAHGSDPIVMPAQMDIRAGTQ